jgi:hypothetical protein
LALVSGETLFELQQLSHGFSLRTMSMAKRRKRQLGKISRPNTEKIQTSAFVAQNESRNLKNDLAQLGEIRNAVDSEHDTPSKWFDRTYWISVVHFIQRILGELVEVCMVFVSLDFVHFLVDRINVSSRFKEIFSNVHEVTAIGVFIILGLRFYKYLWKH